MKNEFKNWDYNSLATEKAKAEGLQVQSFPGLYGELKTSKQLRRCLEMWFGGRVLFSHAKALGLSSSTSQTKQCQSTAAELQSTQLHDLESATLGRERAQPRPN